jgi:hypothetical protein
MAGHVAGATAVALAFVAAPALAAESESIRLDYRAPEGCPDQVMFEAAVRAHTPQVSFVKQGEVRACDVRIDAGVPTTGRLVVRRDGRIEGSRQLEAASCAEAADALALMVALAVDPTALLPPPTAESAAAPAGLSSSPAPAPTGAATRSPPSSPPETLRPYSASQSGAEPLAPVVMPSGLPHTFYLGAAASVVTNVAPSAIVAAAPYGGWRGTRRRWTEPEVRVALVRGSSATFAVAGGTASFTWTVGQADGCLLSWPEGPARVLACARLEAGVLEGTGSGVAFARSADRGWLSAGPLLRFEWTAVAALFFDADVAAMVHVTDDRFYFAPDATIYTVPVGGLEAALGLGIHFL